MSDNPAIQRRPSGDVDIALPQDESESSLDTPRTGTVNPDGIISGAPATAE
jgi:hypothetical protein